MYALKIIEGRCVSLNLHTNFSPSEFLHACDGVYHELQEAKPSAQDPVVVPTSEEGPPPPPPAGQKPDTKPDGVDSMQFFRALVPICEKLDLLWVQYVH